MSNTEESERTVQNRVIDLFQRKSALDYVYYGNFSSGYNDHIIEEKLQNNLRKRGYEQTYITQAIHDLKRSASNLQQGIYCANQRVYDLLKYGVKISTQPNEAPKTIYLIDWENPQNNEFAIAEEVALKECAARRPDLVIYVNGIALAVIELKKSTVSVSHGVRQCISNQNELFNPSFYSTVQFVMAGNESEGMRYGTIGTKEKYFLEWKNEHFHTPAQPLDTLSLSILEQCNQLTSLLEAQLLSIYHKERFLDLIHNFIIFDKGIKKICRYNQFFGIKKAQLKLQQRQGGIIWHTQGSGKTLTMVWLSKWILANNPQARILIVTDREELDEQIEKVFKGVNESVCRIGSCKKLIEELNYTQQRLICSLIHKFGLSKGTEDTEHQYQKSVEEFIKELREALPVDFKAKGEFVVFVDECHRSQSGLLHAAMKEILPEAIFIGFTGTPLLVKDKKTSIEVFKPGYIHSYKYGEAVKDGVVLDLLYEARDVDQVITAQDKIDQFFEAKTRGLNDTAKAKLKAKWGNMQSMYSSRKRLEVIAEDIITDFDTKERLENGLGNALLIADSVYAACKYYEIFQHLGFKKCAIVTSFVPNKNKLRTETEDTEEFEKYDIYTKMLNGQSPELFEAEAKRKFIDEPANMQLLIVVDKLLTGFDAPPCTYLYIDKSMQDHGLFQAICRVNRLDGEGKNFGYIIDYKQLFGHLTDALNKYMAGAFEGFAPEDIEDFVKDRLSELKKYFDATLEELDDLCDGVPYPRAEINYAHYFCGVSGEQGVDDEFCVRSREKLYKLSKKLIRAYAELKPQIAEVGYNEQERIKIQRMVEFYTELSMSIEQASGDRIDLKAYEPDMRRLIDLYVKSEDSRKIGEFDDFTLLDFVLSKEEELKGKGKEAAAEAIENNIRRKIVEKNAQNPKYYEKMSVILEELIKERKAGSLAYEKILARYIELVKMTSFPENNLNYPSKIRKSGALRALYDNCGENEELALRLDHIIKLEKQDAFRGDEMKERTLKRALYKELGDESEVERIFEIIKAQEEY